MNSIIQAVMGLVLAIIGLALCTTAVAKVAPLQDLANASDAAGPPALDSSSIRPAKSSRSIRPGQVRKLYCYAADNGHVDESGLSIGTEEGHRLSRRWNRQ